jgi:hypothetical protein
MTTKRNEKSSDSYIVLFAGIAALAFLTMSAKARTIKYSCIDNTCIEDLNGIYDTLQECNLACIGLQKVDVVVNE